MNCYHFEAFNHFRQLLAGWWATPKETRSPAKMAPICRVLKTPACDNTSLLPLKTWAVKQFNRPRLCFWQMMCRHRRSTKTCEILSLASLFRCGFSLSVWNQRFFILRARTFFFSSALLYAFCFSSCVSCCYYYGAAAVAATTTVWAAVVASA